ncbi:MAG: hypothetical protein S4CHLAM6_02490 [Chlamydiae bacterium]|nr:hypothetical protein [Chlamydiota bacterium]
MGNFTLEKAGLTLVCATSILTSLELVKRQIVNIYQGDHNGSGPYDSRAKRVGQASLAVISSIAVLTAFESFMKIRAPLEIEVEFEPKSSVELNIFKSALASITNILPITTNIETIQFAISSSIATIGSISSICNIITGDKAIGKPYETVSKRLLNAAMVTASTLAFIRMYRINPELCLSTLSSSLEIAKTAAKITTAVASPAAGALGVVFGGVKAVAGGAFNVAKYAYNLF